MNPSTKFQLNKKINYVIIMKFLKDRLLFKSPAISKQFNEPNLPTNLTFVFIM